MFRRVVPGLMVLGLVGAIGQSAISCGSAEVGAYDYSVSGAPCDRGFATCSSDQDCYTGYVYELGTMCMDGLCRCPNEGDIICNGKNHPPDDNQRGCRNPRDCEPGEVCFDGGVPGDAGGESDAMPPPASPECTEGDVSMCPGPPDKRCGKAACAQGKCALKITPGPIASQEAGDCHQAICDATGVVINFEDPSDYYDDGAECTFDVCINGNVEAWDVTPVTCPETENGICSQGECVQCINALQCSLNENCSLGRCVPMSCTNNMLDVGETDLDCGGKCLQCANTKACMLDSDCRSGLCKNLQCAIPSCSDGTKNDGETDVDCGAACKGKRCGEGQGCETGDDCQSGVCWAGACKGPTCTDGVQNGDETGVDCGVDCGECL